jgi:hypothetical protein
MKTPSTSISTIGRRKILKVMAGLPFAGTLGFLGSPRQGNGSYEEMNLVYGGVPAEAAMLPGTGKPVQFRGTIPSSKIGQLNVSRMIMGGNLLGGWAHSRDLLYVSELVKAYHTDEKIFQTLQLAEQGGVNALITNPVLTPVLQKYWKRGGKIKFISDGGWNYRTDIRKSIDAGASACYLHGGRADGLVKEGKLDEIAWALEEIRKSGIPAGIGAHELETVKTCVSNGLIPDFWMKTLHKNSYWSAQIDHERKTTLDKEFADNIFCQDPEATIAFMNNLEQPWIAYKILAAGAINPKDAFKWAFEQGADFICVGMFDFQVVDNIILASDILQDTISRGRPWR